MPPLGVDDLRAVLDKDLQPLPNGGGMVIGVYRHGSRRVMTWGIAKEDSLFEIGSITKTFTGLLLAQMALERKVTLDEPVRLLLPENTVKKPRTGDEITLVDLATHRSGLPGMPDNLRGSDTTQKFVDYRPADLYNYLANHGVRKPDEVEFAYSNLGFSVLGEALANSAGVRYEELLRQRIIEPLGLHDTSVSLSPELQMRLIQGHDDKGKPVPAWDLDGFAAAGGIRSTAGDMLTYLEAQLHQGGAIAESHKLQADAANGTRVALGWFYAPGSGTYLHDGGTLGYSSYVFFNPAGNYAGAVLLNNGPSITSSADLIGAHLHTVAFWRYKVWRHSFQDVIS